MTKPVIIQLKEQTIKSDTDISNLIRKAYTIARKLTEFSEWLKYELNGYEKFEGREWPEYRIATGELETLDRHGRWIAVSFQEPSMYEKVCKQKIKNSISSIKDILQGEIQGAVIPLSSELNNTFPEKLNFYTKYRIYINRVSISKVYDAVKNIVLEWSLELEEQGIEGEGLFLQKLKKIQLRKQH